MFKFLQRLFEGEHTSEAGFSSALIDAAIERAVDGTDPRLRIVSGYQKRLRGPVTRSVAHVFELVDSLAQPVLANRETWSADSRLSALFTSADRMLDSFAADAALRAARQDERTLVGLLASGWSLKRTLGVDVLDGESRRDVKQTILNFEERRLLEVTNDLSETLHGLRQRAFDDILGYVLILLQDRDDTVTSLTGERKLLNRRLELLKQGGWGFGSASQPANLEEVEEQLQALDEQLASLGGTEQTLDAHLEIIVDVLSRPHDVVSLENREVHMDHLHILRDADNSRARSIDFQLFHRTRGFSAVVLPVQIEPGTLPERDLFKAAVRYLR